jgi:hypothetical protein
MAIFNSYVSLPEGTSVAGPSSNPQAGCYVVLEQILVWKDPSNYKDI